MADGRGSLVREASVGVALRLLRTGDRHDHGDGHSHGGHGHSHGGHGHSHGGGGHGHSHGGEGHGHSHGGDHGHGHGHGSDGCDDPTHSHGHGHGDHGRGHGGGRGAGAGAGAGEGVWGGAGVSSRQISVDVGKGAQTAQLTVNGMTCSGCAARVEGHLRKGKGVVDVKVSMITCKVQVSFIPGHLTPEMMAAAVNQLGFVAEVDADSSSCSVTLSLRQRTKRRRNPKDTASAMTSSPRGSSVEIHNKVNGLASAIRGYPGVEAVVLQPQDDTPLPNLRVDYNPAEVGARDILNRVQNRGTRFQVSVARSQGSSASAAVEAEFRRTRFYVIVCCILCLPVTILAVVVPSIPAANTAMEAKVLGSLGPRVLLLLVFTTPIQLYAGWPLYKMAWGSLYHTHRANMDVLVMLSTTTAYLYSLVSVCLMLAADPDEVPDNPDEELVQYHTFFETSAYLLTLILIGRLMGEHAKGKTSRSLSKLMNLQARAATLVTHPEERGGPITEKEIDISLIQRGDLLKVLPGAQVPSDGVVVQGMTSVDESMLTGEPVPKEKGPGSTVVGGTVNQMGVFTMRVTKAVQEATLAQICNLVEQAQTTKAPVQYAADKVAAFFTPVIVVLSFVVLITWYTLGITGVVETAGLPPGAFALAFALAVLVVSCPCAVALAVPTAVMVGTGVGARLGVLIKGGAPLERMDKVTAIIFDKTGTITAGMPSVVRFARPRPGHPGMEVIEASSAGSLRPEDVEFWQILGTAERSSEHPLAQALVEYAHTVLESSAGRNARLAQPQDSKTIPGKGVTCRVGGRQVRVGKIPWVARESRGMTVALRTEAEGMERAGVTVIAMAVDGTVAGIVGLSDVPRAETKAALKALRMRNIEVWMVSGDNQRTCAAVAKRVGVPLQHVMGGVLPEDKARAVELLQNRGHVVAMVGDGVNDSVALAAADVGMGMGGGTDIALEAAQVVFLRNDLRDVLTALQLSSNVLFRIRLNFVWAFLYNVIAMPFAAGVFFPFLKFQVPVAAAGISELLSSVPVILFSLLINRFKPDLPQVKEEGTVRTRAVTFATPRPKTASANPVAAPPPSSVAVPRNARERSTRRLSLTMTDMSAMASPMGSPADDTRPLTRAR